MRTEWLSWRSEAVFARGQNATDRRDVVLGKQGARLSSYAVPEYIYIYKYTHICVCTLYFKKQYTNIHAYVFVRCTLKTIYKYTRICICTLYFKNKVRVCICACICVYDYGSSVVCRACAWAFLYMYIRVLRFSPCAPYAFEAPSSHVQPQGRIWEMCVSSIWRRTILQIWDSNIWRRLSCKYETRIFEEDYLVILSCNMRLYLAVDGKYIDQPFDFADLA